MKAYNYLLFRIYTYYKDNGKNETENLLVFSTACVVTLIGVLNIMWIYFLCLLLDFFPHFINKFYLFGVIFLVFMLLYNFNIKDKKFLNHNFEKDRIGGFAVVGIFFLTGLMTFIVGTIYRNKVLGL